LGIALYACRRRNARPAVIDGFTALCETWLLEKQHLSGTNVLSLLKRGSTERGSADAPAFVTCLHRRVAAAEIIVHKRRTENFRQELMKSKVNICLIIS
jgi:hypothetical protein